MAMPNKLIEGASSKLGESWIRQVLTPAFAFWLVGLMAWMWATGWDEQLTRFETWSSSAGNGTTLIVVAILALLVVATSGGAVERLTLPVLTLIEGYWPAWLRWPQERLRRRQKRRWLKFDAEWRALKAKVHGEGESAHDQTRLASLDSALRRFPSTFAGPVNEPDELMPTRVGNILRAGEFRPRDHYGLEPTLCWTHFWLLIPDSRREELRASRTELDASIGLLVWALLSAVWSIWIWWIPLASALTACAVYEFLILPAARTWADQVEAVFDLDRTKLYQALRLELPTSPPRSVGMVSS